MGKSGKKWESTENPLNQGELSSYAFLKEAFKTQGVLIVSRNLSQLIGRQGPHVHSGPVPRTDQIGPRTAASADTWLRPVLISLPDGCLEKNRGADGLLEHLRPGRSPIRKNRPKGDG